MTQATSPHAPIILFDAECVLCSSNAQFVLRHDRLGHFRLAAMQGEVGAALGASHGIDPADPVSILVIEAEHVYRDSDAVLRICQALDFPWHLMALFRIVPRCVRDPAYRWIARNRYRLFGKRDTCWIAPAEFRSRIL